MIFNGDIKELRECVVYCTKDVEKQEKTEKAAKSSQINKDTKNENDETTEKEKVEDDKIRMKFGKYGGINFYLMHRMSLLTVKHLFMKNSENEKKDILQNRKRFLNYYGILLSIFHVTHQLLFIGIIKTV